jgi:microcystin-dependent protein
MREIFADDGGRPFFNEDLLLLQSELTESIAAQVRAFGNAMVVIGCELSPAVTPGNFNIAAGLVYLDGRFQRVEPVADVTLPVYVISSGVVDVSRTYKTGAVKVAVKEYKAEIVTDEPGAGEYVTINAVQDQYYKSILRNSIMPVGSILMTDSVVSFDTATGLGSGAWLGWALCDGQNATPNMKGRFVVGFDKDSANLPTNMAGLVRNYGAVGNTGGGDTVTLTQAQLPNVQINSGIFNNGGGYDDGSTQDNIGTNPTSSPVKTAALGSGQAHENRPPYIVLAYVKKIA